METIPIYTLDFDEIGLKDVTRVGGKNASLGQLFNALKPMGVGALDGFATTADAYRRLLIERNLEFQLRSLLSDFDPEDVDELAARGHAARAAVLETPLPDDLRSAILTAYDRLCARLGREPELAVRSSATAEDLPEASFAGQQETFLNVRGREALAARGASLLRLALYRPRHQLSRASRLRPSAGRALGRRAADGPIRQGQRGRDLHARHGIGLPRRGRRDRLLRAWRVRGAGRRHARRVDGLQAGARERPSRDHRAASRLQGGDDWSTPTAAAPRAASRRRTKSAAASRSSDDEVLKLARWACLVEEHYSELAGHPQPMDLEWAKDGLTGELFILQARPETVHSAKPRTVTTEVYRLKGEAGEPLVTGQAVGEKIGAGRVRVVRDAEALKTVEAGDVLVTEMTDPDWEPVMKRVAALVTDQGGRTAHAAIISRELGLPCIVGAGDATGVLRDGDEVTVCCAEGSKGDVYAGRIPFEVERVDAAGVPQTRTQVMLNIGDPSRAFSIAAIPNAGVGLARLEFIVNNHIGIHPMALARYPKLKDPQAVKEIAARIGEEDPREFFIRRLSEGVGRIAAAFYPKPVIVRTSDFKTNEYARLLGGREFEPEEENPMLGFRGASRYYDPRYAEGFALECAALARVRREMGLANVKVMIPFCRTVDEGKRVIEAMAANGLKQGEDGLEVYAMCELPSNVVSADEFLKVFDGYSIGSNDLTQLVLGLDRDSGTVAHLFDERNAAVRQMIARAIEAAHSAGKPIGICGQAPSDYPDFAGLVGRAGNPLDLAQPGHGHQDRLRHR